MDRNVVWLIGFFDGKPQFHHEYIGKQFFSASLNIQHGKHTNMIPVIIPQNVLDGIEEVDPGRMYEVDGSIRSRKTQDNHVEQYVFVTTITPSNEMDFRNEVHISGQVRRPPKLRITNSGKPITSILLCVGRDNSDRYDNILCYGFDKMEDKTEQIATGELIEVDGYLNCFKAKSTGVNCLEVHISHFERETVRDED